MSIPAGQGAALGALCSVFAVGSASGNAMTVVRLEATATRLQLQLQCHALLSEVARAVAVGKTEMSSVDRIFVRILRRTVQKGVLLTATNIWALLEQVHREVMTAAAYTQYRRTKGEGANATAGLEDASAAAHQLPPAQERPLVVGSAVHGAGAGTGENDPRGPKTKVIKSNETSAGAVLLPPNSPTRRALSRGGSRPDGGGSLSSRTSLSASSKAGDAQSTAGRSDRMRPSAASLGRPHSPDARTADGATAGASVALSPGQIWDDQLDNSAAATSTGLPQSPGEMDNEPTSTKLAHPGWGGGVVPPLDLSTARLRATSPHARPPVHASAASGSRSPDEGGGPGFAFSPGTGTSQLQSLAMSPVAPSRAGARAQTAPGGGRRLVGSTRAAGKLLRGIRGGARTSRTGGSTGVKGGLQQGLPGVDGGSTISEGGGARLRHVDTSEPLEADSAAEAVDAAEAVGWPIVLTVPIAVLLNFLRVDWDLYFDWLAERGLRHPVVALNITEIAGEGMAGGGSDAGHGSGRGAAVPGGEGEQGGGSAPSSAASVSTGAGGQGASGDAASAVGFSLGAVDAIVHEQARAEAAQDDAAKRHALANAMKRMREERASVRSESARSAARFSGVQEEGREGTVAMSESTESVDSSEGLSRFDE